MRLLVVSTLIVALTSGAAFGIGGDGSSGDGPGAPDGDCCGGIDEFERGFSGDSGGGDNPKGGFGGVRGGDAGIILNRLPATDREVALEMLVRFRDLDPDPLAYLALLAKPSEICSEIGSCAGLDPETVQGMARLAKSERDARYDRLVNSLPAWLSMLIAAAALFFSLRTERRSARNEIRLDMVERDHG